MNNSEALELFFKFFSRALMLLLVMPLTNSARGLVAKWMGDDSAEYAGRITLNPMAHLDPIGSLMILLIGFGWSKPMPITFSRMKNMRAGVVAVSLAGPVSHFLSAIVCKLIPMLFMLVPTFREQYTEYLLYSGTITPFIAFDIVLSLLSQINVCLGVINLLPLPPMDGFQVLNQFAGAKFHNWYYSNYQLINQVSTLILFALFFCGRITGGHFDPLGWLIILVDSLLTSLVTLPFMLLGAL